MENILICQAQNQYAESYCRAVETICRERKYLASITGFSSESTRNFVKMIVEMNYAQFYAINNGRVIGWCDIIPKEHEGLDHVGVLGMGLLEPYRNKGIGKKLFADAVHHAVKFNSIEKIELEVFESNIFAIRFYEKQGFLYEGKRMNARKIEGKYDNILLMGLFIKEKNESKK